MPLPPVFRTVQLEYEKPTTGTQISPVCKDFFLQIYGLDQYKACIIKRVRVWSGTVENEQSTLSVAVGSPWGNTVPSVSFDDTSKVGDPAKVGYFMRGSYNMPWSMSATYAVINSNHYPVLVEFSAHFL